MRGINELIRASGASPATVNIAVIIITLAFVAFLGLMGFEVVWDTINNLPLAPWVSTVIGACVVFITTTLTSIHVSNSVEQSVKTASETTTNASLQAQKQADDHALNIMQTNGTQTQVTQANTQAMKENTQAIQENASPDLIENTHATQANTQAMKERKEQ